MLESFCYKQMINENYAKLYCCEDISLIENYQAAMADTTQTWDCHHRLEIQGPFTNSVELQKNRAAHLGKHHTDEAKQKNREAHLGEKHPAYGKHWWNNGVKNVLAKECPDGFVAGRIHK